VIKYSTCSFHVGEQHKYYTLDENATFCHSLSTCTQHALLQHSPVMHFPNFPARDHVRVKTRSPQRILPNSYLAMVTILIISFYPPSHQGAANPTSNRIPVATTDDSHQGAANPTSNRIPVSTTDDYQLFSFFLHFRPKNCCVRGIPWLVQ
jgi:hypothetical protein